MALSIYECDTCKRTIEKKRNEQGLDIINNCIITNGCKGKMQLIDVKIDHNIPSSVPSVEGLQDWIQRKVLYTHTQNIISTKWRVVHNLGVSPIINTFIHLGQTGELTKVKPKRTTLIDQNTVEVEFEQPYTGTLQAFSRSSSEGQKITSLSSSSSQAASFFSFSSNNEIIIATKYQNQNVPTEDYIDITFTFLNPSTFVETEISPIRFETINSSSSWGDGNNVAIRGELLKLRSEELDVNELINLKIQNGSPFYVKQVWYGSNLQPNIPNDEIYFMLTSPPYQIFDKELTRTLDISSLTKDNAFNYTSLLNYELNALDKSFESIFPHIDVIV